MGLRLAEVVNMLGEIAPLELAEPWDNVGLLVEPCDFASGSRRVSRVLLTIDLTEAVCVEAAGVGADLVVAYHPPIFSGLKRLCASAAQSRVVVSAIEARIAVYSPHTALDAAPGGVNDWLASGLGASRIGALAVHPGSDSGQSFKVVVFVPAANVEGLREALAREAGAGQIGDYSECSFAIDGKGTFFGSDASAPVVGSKGRLETADEVRLELVCSRSALPKVAGVIETHHPYEEPAWDIYPLLPKPRAEVGMGRLVELALAASLPELVGRLKQHLGLDQLRVAACERHRAGVSLSRVAVCAGAGGGLFEGIAGVDLFVTGEMRHHDVLAKLANGASVVLCEHTHTERGFLPTLAQRLETLSGGRLEIVVSERDAEPLRIE
jgi:dinuclear metal center YbgI/SA1388 family protein